MNNTFDTTVESLFKGMDSFITTKTVVGDAVTIGDTIILPLVDVSFGVGAGALRGRQEAERGRRYGSEDFPQRHSGDLRRCHQAGQREESGYR